MTLKDYQTLANNYLEQYYYYNRLIFLEFLPSKKAKLREYREECCKQIVILYTQYELQNLKDFLKGGN